MNSETWGVVRVRQRVRVQVPLGRVISNIVAERRRQRPVKPFHLPVSFRMISSREVVSNTEREPDRLQKFAVGRGPVIAEQ